MYRIVMDDDAGEQVTQMPAALLTPCAEVLAAIEVAPWYVRRLNPRNSDGAVRSWPFGPYEASQVVYLVLEQQREVHVLSVMWVEL